MERRIIFLALMALVCVFCGLSRAEEPVRLMIVSDLHFLAPECFEEGQELFETIMRGGDGKMSQYSLELLSALEAETAHQKPDALVVTGDLSFNGEKASHEMLAQAFARIKSQGIAVWVIPGNHDINNPDARKYISIGYTDTENISSRDFARVYEDFSSPEKGPQMSCVVRLRENLWLVMCDASVYDPAPQPYGVYSDSLRAWLRGVLAEAKEAGAQVITATHQSVVPHTSLLRDSMTVHGQERMLEDLRESSVCRLILSGHLHIQHISEEDGIFDIATGSFSLPPFRYGIIQIEPNGAIQYTAQAICPEHLSENLNHEAKNWFREVTIRKLLRSAAETELPAEDLETMINYAALLNEAYFTGTLDPANPFWTHAEGYALWKAREEKDTFADYLLWLLHSGENDRDMLRLELSF